MCSSFFAIVPFCVRLKKPSARKKYPLVRTWTNDAAQSCYHHVIGSSIALHRMAIYLSMMLLVYYGLTSPQFLRFVENHGLTTCQPITFRWACVVASREDSDGPCFRVVIYSHTRL